jgi:serine/threonine protein kinase
MGHRALLSSALIELSSALASGGDGGGGGSSTGTAEGGSKTGGSAPEHWTKGENIGAGAFGQVFLALNQETGEFMAVKELTLGPSQGGSGGTGVVGSVSGDSMGSSSFFLGTTDTMGGTIMSLVPTAALKDKKGDGSGSISNSAAMLEQLETEINVMRSLQHPNIVRYIGTQRKRTHLLIFLEFCSGGSLESLYKKFALEETAVRHYMYGLLKGLAYLHAQQVIHGDLKAANVLVDQDGQVKLADFGCAVRFDLKGQKEPVESEEAAVVPMVGTLPWMAPEVVKQEDFNQGSDIWSVGCTFIELVTRERPWPQFKVKLGRMNDVLLHICFTSTSLHSLHSLNTLLYSHRAQWPSCSTSRLPKTSLLIQIASLLTRRRCLQAA